MERTREFGTMLALGSRPGLVVRLVVLESGIIGLFGTLCGLAIGGLITAIHVSQGVNMTTHGVVGVPGVTNIIYPKMSVAVFAVPGILLPMLVLLAAFYPAFRASRLDPVKAMRHA